MLLSGNFVLLFTFLGYVKIHIDGRIWWVIPARYL